MYTVKVYRFSTPFHVLLAPVFLSAWRMVVSLLFGLPAGFLESRLAILGRQFKNRPDALSIRTAKLINALFLHSKKQTSCPMLLTFGNRQNQKRKAHAEM